MQVFQHVVFFMLINENVMIKWENKVDFIGKCRYNVLEKAILRHFLTD